MFLSRRATRLARRGCALPVPHMSVVLGYPQDSGMFLDQRRRSGLLTARSSLVTGEVFQNSLKGDGISGRQRWGHRYRLPSTGRSMEQFSHG